MKKFLKILIGIVGVIAMIVAIAFYFTSGMVTTADDFFAAVKNQNMGKAYAYVSEGFKAKVSQSDLEAFLKSNQIHNFKEASWASRSRKGDRGQLEGSITTKSGDVVPIAVGLVKGENGWKIYSISKPPSGIQTESSVALMPTEQEMVQLVSESMKVFGESVNAQSMAAFHSHISNLWQKQFSIEKLDETFGGLYNKGLDFTLLDNYSPQFQSQPTIDENGILVINGSYPTQPSQVQFEQKYLYEGLGWKLFGMSVSIE